MFQMTHHPLENSIQFKDRVSHVFVVNVVAFIMYFFFLQIYRTPEDCLFQCKQGKRTKNVFYG